MIKADGPAKVKERLRLNALRDIILTATLLHFVPCLSLAQVSEGEVQNIEQQEFGIESGKTKKPEETAPQQAPTPPSPPLEDVQAEAEPEKIKPIEAEEFQVKVQKKSHSGRVLLLEDAAENHPKPGKILLIKNGKDEIAAVRVLKNYPAKFAAKVVLPFNETQLGQEYRALKKIGDKIIALIKEREKRGKDLDAAKTDEELAREVSPDDNELDRGIPPPKAKNKKSKQDPNGPLGPVDSKKKPVEPLFNKEGVELGADSIVIEDEDEPLADLSVQEELPLDPYHHAFTLEYGILRNVDKNQNSATYSGLGFRYAYSFARMLLLKKRNIQDILALELSLFYYSISDFSTPGDNVTVFPLIGALRYSVLVSESLSFFTYLGFVKNNVSQSGTSSSAAAVLGKTTAALGLGAMLKIGPAWAIRADVGLDLFGIGAVLKF